ncbi:hypothetical protein niasHT_036431 [Heterodera trifolii]|uniref:Uncharacterized protein n=1 Tax=Heterodera trifolii TaxID=157864 RepID=A0ABD2HQS8_9BILA
MVKRTTFEWQEVKIMKPIWMRSHAELEQNDNSITKDFYMPLDYFLYFFPDSKMSPILYVPKTPTAGAFQIQNLALSSGTMKFSGEGKKIDCRETDKKKALDRTQWLKTWIVIKIAEEKHFFIT